VLTRSGMFYPLASSNTVITPRDSASRSRSESWAPPPAPGGQIAEDNARTPVAGAAVESARTATPAALPPAPPARAEESGAEGTGRTDAAAEEPPGSSWPGGPPWAARPDISGAGIPQDEAAAPLAMESGRGLLPPGPGIPPGADWVEAPTSAGMALGGLIPGPAQREAGFWFVLNTELVVYGATQPDAHVTLQGRPVRLRPDGTFSLRFQLPDGEQVLPAIAESADGRFMRSITPTVSRRTTAEEQEREAAPSPSRESAVDAGPPAAEG